MLLILERFEATLTEIKDANQILWFWSCHSLFTIKTEESIDRK